MAHLTQLGRDVVIVIEQRYASNCAWYEHYEAQAIRWRMHCLYIDLGITRQFARQLERDATAAAGGWRCHSVPPFWEQFIENFIFT
ncbi:hypothetical protein AAVH_10196 [Aphelenchoides avenae]|nr:hypothetical protein AAVH_10196 [Aphelenchus avenae]